MMRKTSCLLLAASVLTADQLIKVFAVSFRWVVHLNTGVAFGLLSEVGIAGLVSGVGWILLGYFLVGYRLWHRGGWVGVGLLVGGGLGNSVDRVLRGGVVDYLGILGIRFNLADLAIVLGLAIIAVSSVSSWRNSWDGRVA